MSIVVALVLVVALILVHGGVGTILVTKTSTSTKASIIVAPLHHVVGVGSHGSIGIESILPGESECSPRANDGSLRLTIDIIVGMI